MNKKVGVLVLHGIGADEVGFHKEFNAFKERVNKKIENLEVHWQSVFWAKEINEIEDDYFDELSRYNLNYQKLRKFMVEAVADEAAYRKGSSEDNSIYDLVQKYVYEGVKNLYKTMGCEGELLIVSYSMGTTIISDYIWDVQKGKISFPIENDFEGMKKIKYLFTMGSTLPLFLFSLNGITPIVIEKDKWINIYSKNDVLGYPLGIFKEYAEIVEDKEMNVGSLLTSWNPISHLGYFESEEVIKMVAEKIME